MYRTPVKQKSAPCRACLVCGKGAQEVRRIESTKRSEINAKALLAKYGGINVESGVMCRNCYSKLQNLDQRCRLFYEECQRNSRTVMRANTKIMSSSPLSGPQKRINFSKTPTKTRKTQRKTQLFKESAAPESTTPEEIGLKVDFVTGRMCFQVLSDLRFSFFLNSFKLILEERHLARGFKCTSRN